MNLLSSIMTGLSRLRADMSYGGAPGPLDDYWYRPVSGYPGGPVSPEAAKSIGAFHACVNIIGRTVAMLPLKLYQEEADGGKHAASDHPLYDVIYRRPNSLQTSFEFRQMMQWHLELRGNAYAEIMPGNSTGPFRVVDQLLPMHPDRIQVSRLSSGKLQYKYNDLLTNTTRTLLQEEVFHLRNASDDGITGQSTLQLAAGTLGLALAQQDYTTRFLDNDATPPLYIEGAKFKSDEDRKAVVQKWQNEQTGKNRAKTAFIPPGMTIKQLGVNPHDAQLLDARKFSRIEIASLFPLPPHLIGETEKTATYASVEQFAIMYATQCITPRLVNWEQTITRDLLFGDDPATFFPKFSMAALLRGDTASRFGAYEIAIRNGWMCADDIRIYEDMNPLPDGRGKIFYQPQQSIPAGTATEAVNTTTDPQSGNTDMGSQGDTTALAGRLKLHALSAAERCVRKEVNAVRKLLESGAEEKELQTFYEGHAIWMADALHVLPEDAKGYCESRLQTLHAEPDLREFLASAERHGPQTLAELAMGQLNTTQAIQITVNPTPITLKPTINVPAPQVQIAAPPKMRKVVLLRDDEGMTTGAEIREE